jgi:hypothetical protein
MKNPRLPTAVALATCYEPAVILIDDASTGIALSQELRSTGG